jgi:superfamily II DNA or RNA helicase
MRGINKKGVVCAINKDFANVIVNNNISTCDLADLEEDLLLLDRLSKNKLDNYLDFILSLTAYRFLIEYRFNPYVLVSSTKINIFPHQIDEVIKILDNPRMMIADEVGLGKTIIAALVATELRERGLANKILFVVPKSLVIKWQEELSNRFETSLIIINSNYLKMNNNPFGDEIFSYVASIDFLKQKHIMKMIEDSKFDLVIVDEAHKLSFGTERFSLGKTLSQLMYLCYFDYFLQNSNG